ncbi:hypothetical protein OROGR_025589 [Orobanche gracilis]
MRTGSSSSNSRCSSRLMSQTRRPPRLCDCGEIVILYTSHSHDNPDRKFWRCRNWMKPMEKRCAFFKWDDEYDEEGNDAHVLEMQFEALKLRQRVEENNQKIASEPSFCETLQQSVDSYGCVGLGCDHLEADFFCLCFCLWLWARGNLQKVLIR